MIAGPSGRRSKAARLLRLRVRIPPGVWMFVCCECCVLSGRGLWDGLIARPEESYRLWCVCVWVWSRKNLADEEAIVRVGLQLREKEKNCTEITSNKDTGGKHGNLVKSVQMFNGYWIYPSRLMWAEVRGIHMRGEKCMLKWGIINSNSWYNSFCAGYCGRLFTRDIRN